MYKRQGEGEGETEEEKKTTTMATEEEQEEYFYKLYVVLTNFARNCHLDVCHFTTSLLQVTQCDKHFPRLKYSTSKLNKYN